MEDSLPLIQVHIEGKPLVRNIKYLVTHRLMLTMGVARSLGDYELVHRDVTNTSQTGVAAGAHGQRRPAERHTDMSQTYYHKH